MVVKLEIQYRPDEKSMEPVRGSEGAAGWDLYTSEDIELRPFAAKIVQTGIKAQLPHGTVLLILPRSGYSVKNQIIMPNSVGVIDEDYRGGIGITMMWAPPLEECFHNEAVKVGEDVYKASHPHLRKDFLFRIPKFTRIAQALLLPYFEQEWRKVDGLSDTERGTGGFGHTGTGPGPARSTGGGVKIPR